MADRPPNPATDPNHGADHGAARGARGRFGHAGLGAPGARRAGWPGRSAARHDIEGEIFTTRSGSLRYVTDRQKPPIWIQGTKKITLTVVPIES
jgi:hypothetical protein